MDLRHPQHDPSPGSRHTFLGRKIEAVRDELRVPLYRNAYALMLNTIVNSMLGAVYWIVAARTYSAVDVGRDSALVSMMQLVSVLTQLNFSQALMRFLPRAGHGSRKLLLASYGISAALALVASGIVLFIAHFILKVSDPLHTTLLFGLWFVFSTAAWSIFNLQDSALTGLRAAIWIPLENGVFGLIKLVALVALAGVVSDGIYTSWTAPVVFSLIPVNALIFLKILPRHSRETAKNESRATPRVLAKYMAGDYAGAVFTQMSSTFLPVLMVAMLGKAQGAYFYSALTIWIAMSLMAVGITSSLVVEAATDESRTHQFALAVLRRMVLIVLPAAGFVALVAPYLLQLYGSAYRQNATVVLQLFMLSMVPRVVVALWMSLMRLQNKTVHLAVVQFIQAAILIGGTVVFAPSIGLQAVGWAALASQTLAAIVLAPTVVRWLRPVVTE